MPRRLCSMVQGMAGLSASLSVCLCLCHQPVEQRHTHSVKWCQGLCAQWYRGWLVCPRLCLSVSVFSSLCLCLCHQPVKLRHAHAPAPQWRQDLCAQWYRGWLVCSGLCLSVHVCLCFSPSLSLPLPTFSSPSVFLSVCLSPSLPLSLSLPPSLRPSVPLSLPPSARSSVPPPPPSLSLFPLTKKTKPREFKVVIQEAVLPDIISHGVSGVTGLPEVSTLWLGWDSKSDLIFYLGVADDNLSKQTCLWDTSAILLGRPSSSSPWRSQATRSGPLGRQMKSSFPSPACNRRVWSSGEWWQATHLLL